MKIIIVGGGIAGLTAARRAQELGMRVTVLDKAVAAPGCNTRISGGAFHPAALDATAAPAEIMERVMAVTDGQADPELTRTWAHRVGPALDWLKAEGVRFVRGGPLPYQRWVFAPPRPNRPGVYYPGRAGDAALETLERRFREAGGQYVSGAAARELLLVDGAVRGVTADTPDGAASFAGDAVVLCDGGFQANPDLLRQYICPAPELVKLRAAATGTGDALRMALAAGAATVNMDLFYGHVLCRDAWDNDNLWPFPHVDVLIPPGLLVEAGGRRFTDEGWGGIAANVVLARRADPRGHWVIFDHQAWETAGRTGIVPPNPHLPDAGGTMASAGSAAELAAALGIDPAGLAAALAEFNQAAAAGDGPALPVPRSGEIRPLEPPLYGIPIIPGITYTMGGLRINPQAQVVDTGGRPIPGLYAAGGTAGGIDAGPRAGYVGGLAQAVVFGLIAAETAAGAGAPAAAVAAAAAARPADPYPTVRLLVRRGPQLAAALGAAAPLLGLAAWLTGSSAWTLILGILAAPVLYAAVRSYSELARMVSFLLLPDQED